MHILFVSTHDVACGISDYNSNLTEAASRHHDCDIEVLPQNKSISKLEISRIADRAKNYDAIVIQHEWSFIEQNRLRHYDRLRFFLMCLRRKHVPTALIMHSQFPCLAPSRRSLFHWVEQALRLPLVREINRSPKLKLFVHGSKITGNMISQGIKPEKVQAIVFPHKERPVFISKASLSDTITLLMFGFVSAYKGYETALSALRLLPDNFHIVIAGSQHPNAMQDLTYENILGFIQNGLWLNGSRLPHVFKQFGPKDHEAFAKRVIMKDYLPRDNIAEEIAKADIIIAPYFAEEAPAGSGAVEWAISLGKPTIVSYVHTFEDYIKAKCVCSVAPSAPHQLAQAIKTLASSKSEMDRLSSAALAFARENNVEATIKKILSITGAPEEASLP